LKIAITGARGELGQGVVKELLAHDYEIVAIHRTSEGGFVQDRKAENRVANLTDPEAALSALQGCDVLFHLAAIPNPKAADGSQVFSNNVSSSYKALDAAAKLGIQRIIYASSQSVLGNPWAAMLQPVDYIPVDETHPCRLFDPYGLSKLVGEQVAELFCRTAGVNILSFRIPAVWPPEQFEQRINGRLTDQLQAAKSLWAYVDLRDAARAHRLALQANWQGHQVLNITSRWAFGAAPIPELVKQWYPELADIRVKLEAWTAVFDWRKADKVLGFRSRYRWTEEGIIDTEIDESASAVALDTH
jgi:nucleoside-diphosphate-sugar epimerase